MHCLCPRKINRDQPKPEPTRPHQDLNEPSNTWLYRDHSPSTRTHQLPSFTQGTHEHEIEAHDQPMPKDRTWHIKYHLGTLLNHHEPRNPKPKPHAQPTKNPCEKTPNPWNPILDQTSSHEPEPWWTFMTWDSDLHEPRPTPEMSLNLPTALTRSNHLWWPSMEKRDRCYSLDQTRL